MQYKRLNAPTLFLLLIVFGYSRASLVHTKADDGVFKKSNLAAWCIVPFDAKQRSPEARAEMVAKMGIQKIAYDWRQEHVAEFEREILAYQKYGIEFFAFWGMHDDAFRLFEKYKLHPQFWVMLSAQGDSQDEKIKTSAEALLPIVKKVKSIGCKVGIYNHGGWGGEPENMIAVCEYLKTNHSSDNVGIVYNLHHGHGHLGRLSKVIESMKPHLLCLNLNGMDTDGEAKGRKILPLGIGTEDAKVLQILSSSGYNGPIGILNHTDEDAEGRLLDNLDGLRWLLSKENGASASESVNYRTWNESKTKLPSTPTPAYGVPSLSDEFGKALSGGLLLEGKEEYHTLPFTLNCRVKLNSKNTFNILAACNPKSASTHWELYTHAGRGTLALYLPGRGGDYDSMVNICDNQWHSLVTSVDDRLVTLWIDGKNVFEKPTGPAATIRHANVESLAFGRLVEGTLGCDGLLDDVRLSRGVMKPSPENAPCLRLENTLFLSDFNDLSSAVPVVK